MGRRITARAPKTRNSVVNTFFKYSSFRKTLGSNMGAPNLLLAMGAI